METASNRFYCVLITKRTVKAFEEIGSHFTVCSGENKRTSNLVSFVSSHRLGNFHEQLCYFTHGCVNFKHMYL